MKSTFRLHLLLVLFALTGLGLTLYSFQPESAQSVANTVSINLERELQKLQVHALEILQQLKKEGSFRVDSKSDYFFFVFKNRQLTAWSDNRYIPPTPNEDDSVDIKLVRDGTGEYVVQKWNINGRQYLLGVVPLHRSYKIVNEYLGPEWNDKIFPSENITILDYTATVGIPVYAGSQYLFKISVTTGNGPDHNKIRFAAVIILTIAFLLLILELYNTAVYIGRNTPEYGFLFLYLTLLGVRYGMVQLNFPGVFISTQLFNPQFFTSSHLNASLGDMLVNLLVILMLCYYLFRFYYRIKIFRWMLRYKTGKWLLSVTSGLLILFAILFLFVTVQTIYNNSSVVLDISRSLKFDGLRLASITAVLLSGVCAFLFAHGFIRLLIGDKNRIRVLISFTISTILFAVINEFTGQQYGIALGIGVFYFLIIYILRLYAHLKHFSYATFGYLFVSVFCFAWVSAHAVNFYSEHEKVDNQFRFARNFLIDRDYFAEYLLREASQRISGDIFIQSRITSPFLGKDAVRQKVRQFFLPSYFNKYDVEISIFDGAGSPLDNTSPRTLFDIVSQYDTEAFRTEYTGVFFINNPQTDVTQKYLVIAPVKRIGAVAGYIIIELLLKKIIPESVYPELLVDNRFQQFYRTQDISYAVFSGKNIQFTSGDFNYESLFNRELLGKPELYLEGVYDFGYDHIALEDQNGRLAVVSSPGATRMYQLANFSFLFVLGLTIILTMMLGQGVVNYLRGINLFFSARIQLILNLAFFLPLILVSVSTVSLISGSSRQQLNADYINKAKAFAGQLVNNTEDWSNAGRNEIEYQLTGLAKLSNLDANIYLPDGILRASTQPLIVDNSLMSQYINPKVLQKIKMGENLFIEQEQIGKLNFFVAYAALKSPHTGALTGILGIPYYQSSYLLEKVQVTVLANILNIFAGIFIVLLVLSYFVSKWLTFPLSFITQSLKRTSLTRTNQPITWNAKDELGLLAKEYNQMLYKLSESKAELEKTQRERAWREIAQQVAHEVKNPLTPMKLTLQQLERAVQQGTNTTEKTEKALSSLLVQVDTLNEIASSFSSFAKMPEPAVQRLELVSLLKRIVDLHSQSGELNLTLEGKELFVMGDEQLLGRTFSNIILNALQAARPGVHSRVDITLERHPEGCQIMFRDNGKGMLPDVAEQIFVPHFTTKKSGSGLGLAIARQAIEQMNGRIWFDTAVGKGTTFYIQLQLA